MRRLVAIAAALAVCSCGSLAVAGVGAGAGNAAKAGAVKPSKATRCATLLRLASAKQAVRPRSKGVARKTASARASARRAARRRAARRRAAARQARKLGCKPRVSKRPAAPKPVAQRGRPAPAATAPAAATPAGPAAPTDPGVVQPPPAPPPPPPPPPPVTSTVGVGAYDIDGFLLRLTRTSVAAGELTVFFRNYDVADHNLWIEGPGSDVVERISDSVGEGGGGSRTLTVTAGSWRLFCSLPDHGTMTRALTVTP